jgi:hypothetical protein
MRKADVDYLVDGAYNDAGQGRECLMSVVVRVGIALRRGDYYYQGPVSQLPKEGRHGNTSLKMPQ